MSSPASPIADPLTIAVDAETRLWQLPHVEPNLLSERNEAVRDAIASGYTREDIAGALSMRPTDVDRILTRQV